MGLLLEAMDPHDNRFVEPATLDPCDAAVPGLVGGFIPRGACGLSCTGRSGGGLFGASGELVFNRDVSTFNAVGLGGSGLVGGSNGGGSDELVPGLDPCTFNGAGLIGRSFAGGVGGTASIGPFTSRLVMISLGPGRASSTSNSFS
jgi:hypothetical protein